MFLCTILQWPNAKGSVVLPKTTASFRNICSSEDSSHLLPCNGFPHRFAPAGIPHRESPHWAIHQVGFANLVTSTAIRRKAQGNMVEMIIIPYSICGLWCAQPLGCTRHATRGSLQVTMLSPMGGQWTEFHDSHYQIKKILNMFTRTINQKSRK